MSKIFGFKPQPATTKLIDKFEDEVLIRHNNQQLVGTVYVDMQDDRWAVAFAYNYSRKPGLHGHENPLEVRYAVKPQETSGVQVFRSNEETERVLGNEPFADQDAFIRYVLNQERTLVSGSA
ncbi:MAG: hypothetical protein Q7V05_04875 [Methanoregula sp.]|nr:hypothetical protein [Methanoregula sp.]